MAPLLVLYSSLHGQTRKIAGHLADRLRAAGRAVELLDARRAPSPEVIAGAGGVIVGSWVLGGRHRGSVTRFAKRHRELLERVPAAFFSVSLLQRSPRADSRRRAAEYVPRFIDESGWRPALTAVFAGAIAYTRFGWLRKRVMRAIWRREGVDPNITRDHEYTSWPDVDRFADDFLRLVQARERGLRAA